MAIAVLFGLRYLYSDYTANVFSWKITLAVTTTKKKKKEEENKKNKTKHFSLKRIDPVGIKSRLQAY